MAEYRQRQIVKEHKGPALKLCAFQRGCAWMKHILWCLCRLMSPLKQLTHDIVIPRLEYLHDFMVYSIYMSILVAVWLPSPSHLISMRAPFFTNLSGLTYFANLTCWVIYLWSILRFTTAELRFKAQSRLACIELADKLRQTPTWHSMSTGLFINGFVSKWAFPKIPQNGNIHRE